MRIIINKKRTRVIIFFLTVCIFLLSSSPSIPAQDRTTGIVLADNQGNILYEQNSTKQFIPASILKILTSLAALHILGQDYRFPTDFYFDKNSGNLYIKGFGDPLFLSEVIEKFCSELLLKTHTKQIHHIILDPTYFSGKIRIPGKGNSLNPYDAPIGALCANFNTVMFKWSPSKGRFVSAEPQTPLLSFYYDDIIKSRLKQGRIILTREQSILYPGLLIKYFLKKNNVKVTGSVLQGKFTIRQDKKSFFLSPFTTENIVQKLLKFSNNFIANHLLLSMGAKTYGAPATLEKGIKAVLQYSNQYLKLDQFTIFEGSGLSRSNLISPEQMLKVLVKFLPYHTLMKRRENDFFKTGTLSNVRTRAGYILGKNDRLYPYVIMVNQKNKGYESIRRDLINRVYRVSQMVHHPVSQ